MNWKNIISEIQDVGKLTQPQIAEICKCGQATVNDLANGKTEQPRHSLGVALLALLKQVKKKATA
jgi:hypothetical protein